MSSLRLFRAAQLVRQTIRQASDGGVARKAYMDAIAAEQAHAAQTASLWKKISLLFALPMCGLVAYNAYVTEIEHMSHGRPEFVAYPHLRIRNKKFPWGDGNHSIFHGPNNALPEGYED